MKKLIGLSAFFVLLFTIPAFAGIAVTEENFPDAGFREVLTKHECYYQEYNVIVYPDVTSIDCGKSQDVRDLTGINVFEELESLDVSETNLTSLDITGNLKLKKLVAYGTAITALDLSKSSNLSKAVKNGVSNNDLNGGKSYAFADTETGSLVQVDKKVKILLDDGTSVGPVSGYEEAGGSSDTGGSGSSSGQSAASSATIVAAINATNFPDAGFRTVVKTFDTDNDNQLSSEEIDAVLSVDCSGRNISSLKGIEYFTKVTSLNCSSNNLETLDVSRNTDLRSLNCSANKLKTLDISRNTMLNYLNCRSNQITQLDVSEASRLRAAVWKGRNEVSDENYDYFKDPHYMNATIYIHGSAGSPRSIDLSYYLYVDRFVTVKAGDVTNKASVEPPASITAANTAAGTAASGNASSADAVTVSNGQYELSGSTAVLTSPKNKNITSLTLPATVKIGGKTRKVTKISANAFKGCNNLTNVVIGKNVTSIGSGAFSDCRNLKKVTIAAGVKTIGKNAFKNCDKLKTVSGGKGLVTIGTAAFSGCKALQKFTLYTKVKTIGKNAFFNCKKLKNIAIKTSKLTSKTVGANAFKGIDAKASIRVPKAKLSAYKKLLKKKGIGKKAKISKIK